MKIVSLLNHSSEIMRIILKSKSPVDKVLNQYLRSKKYIGGRDRRFISECLFHFLRNLKLINHLCDSNSFDFNQRNAYFNHCLVSAIIADLGLLKFSFLPRKILNSDESSSLEDIILDDFLNLSHNDSVQLKNWFDSIRSQYLNIIDQAETILNSDNDKISESMDLLCLAYSINPWIVESWESNYVDSKKAFSIAKSLLFNANIGIRTKNPEIRSNIVQHLNEIGINVSSSKLSPSGIEVNGRYQLTELDVFKQGLIEIQDIGSQLISYAVSPIENSRILDACAGAGGKTLHLASLQNDTGEIVASDIEYNRLKEISKRAKRSGYKSITSIKVPANQEKWNTDLYSKIRESSFDYVLVDAPCSGMGTSRRSPMVKWNLNEKLLNKLQQNQLRILSFYSKFVKSGGILVYATCSLMPQENEKVVSKFLNENSNFSGDELEPVFQNHGIVLPESNSGNYYLTLNPFDHNTDGFFIARMRKVN